MTEYEINALLGIAASVFAAIVMIVALLKRG